MVGRAETIVGARERARLARELASWIGRQVAELRIDAGVTPAELARCVGVHRSYIARIERGAARPSLDTLTAIGACLGADVSVRFFPTAAPRLRDRFQAPMVEALLAEVGPPWRHRVEVPVPAARGVVDIVLSRRLDHLTVVCECHSELRRLELAIRKLAEKTDALRGQLDPGGVASSLLLLRSTEATRATARAHEATLAAAFHARTADAVAALKGDAAWPGPAIVWATVQGGRAKILDGPPRGVRVGR